VNWLEDQVNEQERRYEATQVYIPVTPDTEADSTLADERTEPVDKMDLESMDKMSAEEVKAYKKAQMKRLIEGSEQVMKELPMSTEAKFKPSKTELKEQQRSGTKFDVFFEETSKQKRKTPKK
jgi:hypothetical protein